MTQRATIAALHKETEALLANLHSKIDHDDHIDHDRAVDLITRSRLALSLAHDDGLGPWESPELEYALHMASRHQLTQLALICACEVLAIAETSLYTISDSGFFSLLA